MANQKRNPPGRLPEIAIIADSWLEIERVKSILTLGGGSFINLKPHVQVYYGKEGNFGYANKAEYHNFAKSGLTMKTFVNRDDMVGRWVKQKIDITVIHLGAADILNTPVKLEQPKVDIPEQMINFLLYLIEIKKLNTPTDEFTKWIKKHRFLVYQLADWGPNFSNKSMKPEDYKHLVRKVNKGYNRKKMFKLAGAFLLKPCLDYAQYQQGSVHLKSSWQNILNETIITAIGKLICMRCRLNENSKEDRDKILVHSPRCGIRH